MKLYHIIYHNNMINVCLTNNVYLFPKSLFVVEFMTKILPNPKSEVKTDLLPFDFVKQFVSIDEHRRSWEFIKQKFWGSNFSIEKPIINPINIKAETPSGTHFNIFRFSTFR